MGYNNIQALVAVLIGLAFIILLFIILRELVMWYWKINERIRLQKETNELLTKLINQNKEKASINDANEKI